MFDFDVDFEFVVYFDLYFDVGFTLALMFVLMYILMLIWLQRIQTEALKKEDKAFAMDVLRMLPLQVIRENWPYGII